MNVECEQCHAIGYLQKLTTNYFRIRHYSNGKFFYHQVSKEYAEQKLKELNVSQISPKPDQLVGSIDQLNIDQLKESIDQDISKSGLDQTNEGGRSLVWSRTSACHADDPGSNLGDRTILAFPEFLRFVNTKPVVCARFLDLSEKSLCVLRA